MIDKIKLSLWDFFAFLITGMVIIINLGIYIRKDTLINFFQFDLTTNDTTLGFLCFALTYTIGLLYEPIAYFTFSMLKKWYKPLFKTKKLLLLKKEKKEVYSPLVKSIIKEKYKMDTEHINAFQFARLFLTQSTFTNNYLIFLSRYGFYRNLTIISLLNIPALLLYNTLLGRWSTHLYSSLLIIVILSIMHILLYIRALEFFNYAGNETYRFFLMNHDQSNGENKVT